MTIYVATTGKFEMDYILNGRQKNGAKKLTIILLTASVWTNVGISYVVASRNDVFMGSVIVDTAASFDCSIPGATLIASSTMVAGWAVTATPFKTFTFISGLKTATAPNFLNSSSILDPATGILSLSVIFKETASV